MSEIVSEGYIEVLATPLIPFPFRHKHNAIMCDTFLYDFKQEHTAPIRFNEYSYHARILAHKSLRDSIQYQILGLNTYKGRHHRTAGHPSDISCCEMRPETMNFVEPTGRANITIDVPRDVASEPPVQ